MKTLLLPVLLFAIGIPTFADDDAAANKKTLAKLEKMMLPELSFRNASIFDVVSFLVESSREFDAQKDEAGAGIGVNMIVNARKAPPTVTISLRRVSMKDALDFICDICGLDTELKNGVVVLTSTENPEIEITQKLEELAKTLDLKGKRKMAFEKTANEIRGIAAQLPNVPPPQEDGFPSAKPDGDSFKNNFFEPKPSGK